MMYSETHETRSLASKREYAIKQLTRKEKLNLLKINA
jgi:predicted GIY-YIG superfamily endonuclease